MAQQRLGSHFGAVTVFDGVGASTGAPSAADDTIYLTDRGDEYTGKVRCYLNYTGTVTSGNLLVHGYDGDAFYLLATEALTPASDEVIDVEVGNGAKIAFEIGSLVVSGGTVTLKVEQI